MNFIRTILFFTFLIFNCSLYGQTQIGVKGGVNFSRGKFEHISYNSETKIGYHAGLGIKIKLSDKLYLRPELIYSLKGWETPDDSINIDVSVTLKYINIPLLLEYDVIDNFSLLLGPEFGYKLAAERKPYGPGWIDIYDEFDIGIIFGTNYYINESFAIDLRYIHGFKGLVKGYDQNGNKSSIGNNKVLSLGLFYLF